MDRPIEPPAVPDESSAAPQGSRPRRHVNVAEGQRAARPRRAIRVAGAQKPHAAAPAPLRKPRTGSELLAELKASGLIGIWKDRTDIGDSVEFARRIRERAQRRLDRDGGAGLWGSSEDTQSERSDG